jgi:very-short-patch-repair endonuclease
MLSQHGRWLGAVLCCGSGAVLSHASAAALWRIRPLVGGSVEVTVPTLTVRRQAGIVVHRRPRLGQGEIACHAAIPVTTPICTLIDIAAQLDRDRLEEAVNEADKRGLTDPEQLRAALDSAARRQGTGLLKELLDRRTFTLTDSELERRFLRLVRGGGLPAPRTGAWVNGFKVDFFWPQLGLVVETDGLRYHRTAAQQARDRVRDQQHTASGLTSLRFTHAQVEFEADRVRATLMAVARRLQAG